MEKFNEFKDLVKKKGFGSSEYNNVNGETVYLSRGIKEAFLVNSEEEQKITAAVTRFQKKDFGNAAEYGKESRPGHEYGRYEISSFNECDEDTAVWIHRAENVIKVFFKFER